LSARLVCLHARINILFAPHILSSLLMHSEMLSSYFKRHSLCDTQTSLNQARSSGVAQITVV